MYNRWFDTVSGGILWFTIWSHYFLHKLLVCISSNINTFGCVAFEENWVSLVHNTFHSFNQVCDIIKLMPIFFIQRWNISFETYNRIWTCLSHSHVLDNVRLWNRRCIFCFVCRRCCRSYFPFLIIFAFSGFRIVDH